MKRVFLVRSLFAVCASVSMMMCNGEDGAEREELLNQTAKPGDVETLAKSFTGKVVDASNVAIAGATVTINGIARTTSSTGQYAISVADNPMGYHVEIQKNGYAPQSELYFGTTVGAVHTMIAGNTQLIDPTRANKIIDRASGIEVSLAANSLSTTTGAAPSSPVRFTIIPLSASNMPGDFTAVNASGARVALETVGAATLQAEDSQGRTLGVAANATMTVTIPVPGGRMPDCVLNRQCNAAMWQFDRLRSLWVQKTPAVTFSSTNTVFTTTPVARPPDGDGLGTWNADVESANPACTIVFWIADPSCFSGPGGTFAATLDQASAQPWWSPHTKHVNDQTAVSVLYNLFPNEPTTEISISGTTCTNLTFSSNTAFTTGANWIKYDSGAPWGGTSYPQNGAGTAVLAADALLGDHPCNSVVEVSLMP